MPIEINLGKPPAGYVVKAARSGELASVQYREFTSSEDGQYFIMRLEGFPNDVLEKACPGVRPSTVDHLLAVIRQDGTATVYVNELEIHSMVRATRPMEAGEKVGRSDIAEITSLDLGVDLPADAGFVFLFSTGWRKGLYYDFGPIGGANPEPRSYDVPSAFGQAFFQVIFQERLSITDAEWNQLFAAKWFPFIGLSDGANQKIISHLRSDWSPDDLLEELIAEVKARVPAMLESWHSHSSFLPHFDILDRAVERFQNDDFVSCTGLLFPRIEGILRTYHAGLGSVGKPSPDNLTAAAVSAKIDSSSTLLLPHRFAAYLKEVYFANFNPATQNIDISRHSVAHGVATPAEFNLKSALLAILVVNQLFYFMTNSAAVQVRQAVHRQADSSGASE
jgi:hypothetical protein